MRGRKRNVAQPGGQLIRRYPKTCDYLEAIRISPSIVCEDGVTAAGYESFVLDKSGHRQVGDGRNILRTRHDWPSLEIGQRVIALMREDAAEWGGRW